jgi:hypothetical protein
LTDSSTEVGWDIDPEPVPACSGTQERCPLNVGVAARIAELKLWHLPSQNPMLKRKALALLW